MCVCVCVCVCERINSRNEDPLGIFFRVNKAKERWIIC